MAAGSYQLYASGYGYYGYNNIYQYDIGTQSAAYNGTVAFSIGSAVPEPASWAMLIGVLGGAMRRSRATRVAVRFA